MEYFGKNLRALRMSNDLTQSDIEPLLGFKQTTWNNYELNKSFPKFEDLVRISKYFGISESDLIHANLSDILIKGDKLGKLIEKSDKNVPKKVLELAKNTMPNTMPNSINEEIYLGRQNIVLVEHKVAAGFAQIVHNEESLQALPRFTIPQLAHKMGIFYCFPVVGDSMDPTVKNKEWVIVEQRESISDIKGGKVYMLCTIDGLVLKRLYYKSGDKHIKCVSDNETYSPYKEDINHVLGIYEAVIHFSDDFHNSHNNMQIILNTALERISALEVHVFKKK